MIVALIDNGSLEPAAHRNLRAVAAALSAQAGVTVHAVSWKHSDHIDPAALDGTPAWTVVQFIRALSALGQREFVFLPFFISAQGAIGSALREEIEALQREMSPQSRFTFTFTEGLAARGVIPAIVADRIRSVIATHKLSSPPPVIVVDHGGPSAASAVLRDDIAAQVRLQLADEIGPLTAASLEGEAFAHNYPLLADQLAAPGFNRGPVVIAPLFLSPGRHAGPNGDLAQIARAAEDRFVRPPLRCHFAELIGNHPLAVAALADALRGTSATFQPHIHA